MNVKSNICRAVPLLVACLGLQAWTPALKAASPANCQGCGVAVAPLTSATVVKDGTTVLFDVSVANAIPGACDIVNATVKFYCPKADGTPDLANPVIVVNGTLNLPFGASATVGTGIPCVITTTSATTAQAFAEITGAPGSCLKGPNDIASGTGTTSLQVAHPCLQVTKNCPANNACTPYGQAIQFTGSVINCGDEDFDVTLSDNPVATITPSGTFTVLAGATVNYSGSYIPTANLCGPLADTITATGVSVITRTTAAPTATASCPVSTAPAITITKDCFKAGSPGVKTLTVGDSYVETFTVTNTGNVPLQNVVIHDSKLGNISIASVGGPATLAVGAFFTYTTPPTVTTAADCPSTTDTVTATGDNICPANGNTQCPRIATATSASATCTLTVNCKPIIRIVKEVACALDANTCGAFGPTATGTKGDTCPAFCWKITITNIDPSVSVGSVVVTDTLLGGDISSQFLGFPLAPGQSSEYIVRGKTLCDAQTVNTVTATPYGGANATGTAGDAVTATATAFVKDIQLACNVSLRLADPSFDIDGNPTDNHVTLVANSVGVQVPVYLQLINNGSADLIVRNVSDLPPLVTCDINETPLTALDIETALGLPISIPAGGSSQMTLVGCWIVGCPGGTINVSAHAEADAGPNSTICVRDINGAIVSVNTVRACPATVICEVPASCRVTGGGVLIPGETQTSECSPSIVTQVEGPDCNLTEAVKITHGGQLGAPYANESCGNVALYPLTGDPCIRGQWEHVRHYQGKANPKSTVSVDNFHSNTPKGIFDMVKCACLPCCENPEAGGKIGNLCNPDDHKICGPMPRPAPANAIIFTGVGYMSSCATANAKGKANREPVIFRVYIEDRSEPGGQHPGGANKPADIYCFQAWSLTAINGNNSGKLDSPEAIAARQLLADASCAFIENYTQGALPDSTLLGAPVVNDCGALHTGNQQIHPSTSATCPGAAAGQ